MKIFRAPFAYAVSLLAFSAMISAHPMGNFSVSHYARLQPGINQVEVQYVLDLAEIPTLELLQTWKLERTASQKELNRCAATQAREWLAHLRVSVAGQPVAARLDSVRAKLTDGAGNLPILRVEMLAHVPAADASRDQKLQYEDRNYPERAGWKEIVIAAGTTAQLLKVSQSDRELSHALTQYPADPTIAPPQDLRAELSWRTQSSIESADAKKALNAPGTQAARASAVVAQIPQPRSGPAAAARASMRAKGATAGAVTRGDFLSTLLHQKDLSLSMILVALAAAFGLGAMHALTPGHGKAIVAAYLVGSRGTLKHAAFLGAMVTFTHTITVFLLGLATLFLFRFIVPEKITAILAAASGLSIVVIGAVMLYQRIKTAGHSHIHSHSHTHDHSHTHSHAHGHSHGHAHTHSHHHGSHVHMHSHGPGGHTHSHIPEEVSWGGLVALGASGGLVPCESALVLLLGAIALNRVGLGLLLLLSFSLGLALVLMVIGILVLYAKNLLPESSRLGRNPYLRWISIASPAIVMVVGLLMTAASLGWIQTKWMIG